MKSNSTSVRNMDKRFEADSTNHAVCENAGESSKCCEFLWALKSHTKWIFMIQCWQWLSFQHLKNFIHSVRIKKIILW